jgi:uncharacterized protein YyaL (SSP411 family)
LNLSATTTFQNHRGFIKNSLPTVTVVGRSGSFVAIFSFPRTVLSLVQSTEPTQVQVAGCVRDEELIPLLADRPTHDGRAPAYVCEGYACQNPATDPGGLARQLGIS